jgi:single-strand DNA-binding protein
LPCLEKEREMANLNKVFLIGNLTRDPELRYSPSGTAVAKFGLATNRTYKGQDGEKKEDVCFVDIVAFGKRAEFCANYFSKGKPIFIEGRLQFSTWETPEGQKRSRLEVMAEGIQFMGGPKTGEGIAGEESSGNDGAEDDIPF